MRQDHTISLTADLPLLRLGSGEVCTVFSAPMLPDDQWRALSDALHGHGVLLYDLRDKDRRGVLILQGSAALHRRVVLKTPDLALKLTFPETSSPPSGHPSAVRVLLHALAQAGLEDATLSRDALRQILPSLPVLDRIDIAPGLRYMEWTGCSGSRLVDGAGRPLTAAVRSLESTGDDRVCGFLIAPAEAEVILLDADGALLLAASRRCRSGWQAYRDHAAALPPRLCLRQREALGEVLWRGGLLDGPLGAAFSALQLWQNLPARMTAFDDTLVAAFDLAVPVGEDGPGGSGIFISGRLRDPLGLRQGLAMVSPTGEAIDITPHMVITSSGGPQDSRQFAAFVPVQRGAAAVRQVRGQVQAAGGFVGDLMAPVFSGTWKQARDAVLKSVAAEYYTPAIIERALHPALSWVQTRCIASARIDREETFGTPATAPDVSLIIPLYREYGFIRHQIHGFFADPALANTEIIYVLDRPEDAEVVTRLLQGLHMTYGIPVRLAIMTENAGYAAATNTGCGMARAGHLLLMNSDVVPAGPGWLGPWLARHRAEPNVGVSGARLLYADGALQHAGLFFEQGILPWWTNNHFHKGLPGSHPAALRTRPVPAVTGACALIAADLYRDLGGLSEGYVIGDFEDSDLCLRAIATGRTNLYVAGPALYHFERLSIRHHQSYAQTPAVRYNGWRHTQLWGGLIDRVMRDRGLVDGR